MKLNLNDEALASRGLTLAGIAGDLRCKPTEVTFYVTRNGGMDFRPEHLLGMPGGLNLTAAGGSGRLTIGPLTFSELNEVVTDSVMALGEQIDTAAQTTVNENRHNVPWLFQLTDENDTTYPAKIRRRVAAIRATAAAIKASAAAETAKSRLVVQDTLDDHGLGALGKIRIDDIETGLLSQGPDATFDVVMTAASSYGSRSIGGVLHYMCGKPAAAELDDALERWATTYTWLAGISAAVAIAALCDDIDGDITPALVDLVRPMLGSRRDAMLHILEKLGNGGDEERKVFRNFLLTDEYFPYFQAVADMPVTIPQLPLNTSADQLSALAWLYSETGNMITGFHLQVADQLAGCALVILARGPGIDHPGQAWAFKLIHELDRYRKS